MTASELTAAITAVYDTWMRTVDLIGPVLAEHRLTTATFQALWAVDPDEAPPSMKTLAERLHCNAPNLSFMTNQLADRGLVERVVDPSDRRSRVVVLTAKGRQVRQEVLASVLARTPLGTLNDDELQQLTALLNRARNLS
ncbi:DNA-binding transcriptional regulator, MarR family [Lentzea fradiae]|uniref:DNA-binding transcriptional regulator, MarR family n=1 Tax=Lentzea fradiae TaxID=200378 RepID=A0A1G7PAC6_9PSEU|nr:MarR family winged helix-turn-helix transcriptional regulator [Lentzea fradiae]SDF83228.1 DNA-binding transcriptional regulator, MarR family [Lentzea fradiae]